VDAGPDEETKERRATALKERVYVTFTALAVVLVLKAHHETAGAALVSLVITVTGTVLAVFLAEIMAHIVVHEELPRGAQVRRLAAVTFGASSVLLVPLGCLLLAVLDVLRTGTALWAAAAALLVSLIAIGLAAVRRLRLHPVQRMVVLFAESFVGAVVLALQFLAKR
jgi:ABC-type glycerol-3-phosphate transport system permease component